MKLFCFDTENSGAQRDKANPFNPLNKLCLFSYILYDTETKEMETYDLDFDYTENNYIMEGYVQQVQEHINSCQWIIGFNLKYDLNWGKRYGLDFSGKLYWDVQLFEFVSSNQKNRLPSLNSVLEKYELEVKLDEVKTEYWEKGLDTNQVPWRLLVEYGSFDVLQTFRAFQTQSREYRGLSKALQRTIKILQADLFGLHIMEFHGFTLDKEKADALLEDGLTRLSEITSILRKELMLPEEVPFNPASGHHLSAVIFGGVISYTAKEEYTFYYKDGKKPPAIKTKNVSKEFNVGGFARPNKRIETAREGIYQTNEGVLRSIKTNAFGKRIINLLLEYAKLEKLAGTYYKGYPQRMLESSWENSLIHTNINQCLVVTGRLSSSSPNMQNVGGDVKVLFVSRFKRNQSDV